ncbi:hypothetical protein ACFWBH_01435 [Streptomyces sp. NPDC059999]|uniref:hypothetical protein n=1 Tax=Streptomyces sp. NPDC059999 TaxID=3347030 RepID=UPI0036CFCC76
MLLAPTLRRAALLIGATTTALTITSATGLAHAADPQEYLCADVVTDVDGIPAQASGCVGGPSDYTGPAIIADFITENEWTCDSITTEADPDEDDPDVFRITQTSGCTLIQPEEPTDPGDPDVSE